ncbi:MAG: carbohydrate ABC transporter substrate-binding protein [Pseudomonadota bacterium]|nr:carbohydrate ABC transporter substrate-binding protein [Pseudomonadota bacterium]
MNFGKHCKRLALTTALAMSTLAAQAGELVINTDASDPAPKAAFEAVVKDFEAANPDVKVKINTFDHEGFKTSIRNFLSAEAPDVVTWYAGNRMAPFVNAGLLDDVSDVWAKEGLSDKLKSAEASMTINGKKWGVPYTYYQWGIYYRKDIFARLGINPPKTWPELLAACAKLKADKITPFAIGSKQTWPTGGWFDYLDLRVNGYEFHMDLTAGKVPYTDKRVQAVFDRWDELVKPGYFLANHPSYMWQEALPAFVKGEAAMYLMGNFAVAPMKEAGLKEEQLGFLPFPSITPNLPRSEDAPTDTVHIPAKARNKVDARRFLAFIARADTQSKMNGILGQLPVNKQARQPDDTYLKAGFAMLSSAHALAQFYDRDALPEMAKAGMDGFQRYMLNPDSRNEVLKRLEEVRSRVYK